MDKFELLILENDGNIVQSLYHLIAYKVVEELFSSSSFYLLLLLHLVNMYLVHMFFWLMLDVLSCRLTCWSMAYQIHPSWLHPFHRTLVQVLRKITNFKNVKSTWLLLFLCIPSKTCLSSLANKANIHWPLGYVIVSEFVDL